MNFLNAINNASKLLKKKGIKTAQLDSEILMSEATQLNKQNFIFNLEKKLSLENFKVFNNLIRQRLERKPIAYLTGKKEFWKYEFYVNRDVLIPRPDTELIIEQTLKLFQNKNGLRMLEVGVGSGCIILSLLKERKDFYGIGIDVNKKSLDICKINADKLNVLNKIKLLKSDIDNFNYGKYDLIISNPPYIKKFDLKYLEKDVIGFEPKLALDGGIEGLSEIRKVIRKSSELIKKRGTLILEVGFDQKEKVKKILKNNNFYISKVIKDLGKNNRCIICNKI